MSEGEVKVWTAEGGAEMHVATMLTTVMASKYRLRLHVADVVGGEALLASWKGIIDLWFWVNFFPSFSYTLYAPLACMATGWISSYL